MDQPPQRTRQPNLLLVVDDDHGWDMWPRERSATAGSTQHNIERVLPTFTRLFREEGVTLNHFYVHPKCAPSRQSFMSGRWDWHGTQRNEACHAVSSTYRLMSDVLREAGCDHTPCSSSACLRRSGKIALTARLQAYTQVSNGLYGKVAHWFRQAARVPRDARFRCFLRHRR